MFMVLNQTKTPLVYKGLKNLASSKTYRHVDRIKKNSQLTNLSFVFYPLHIIFRETKNATTILSLFFSSFFSR